MRKADCPIHVLVIPTGGLMVDGVTSWIKNIFSAMNRTNICLDTIAWPETNMHIIDQMKDLGFNVKLLPSRKKNLLFYGMELLKLLKQHHYDIIHVCGSSGLTAIELAIAQCAGIPIRICHSHNTTCQHHVLDKITRPIMMNSATDLLACGKDAGRWLFGDKSFTVIPNGNRISTYRFNSAVRKTVRANLGLTDRQVAIGHVGRFNEQKNHLKLLSIFSELLRRSDEYVLFLIGDGELATLIHQKTRKLGIEKSIRFLGIRNDVPELLNAMDCMVLPSLYEGFPNVVVEWQINGLPSIISSNVTKECRMTSLVNFCSINASDHMWADAIENQMRTCNRETTSEISSLQIKAKGYDIKDDAEILRKFYFDRII